MFPVAFRKELAPLDNRDIDAIVVGVDPELATNTNLFAFPTSTVERNVPQAVAA